METNENLSANVPAPPATLPSAPGGFKITPARIWTTLFLLVLIVAAAFRFHKLETKPMSHDEGLYAYHSWEFATKGEHVYQPLYHGPLMFFIHGLTFFFIGDNDFLARLPVALVSLLAIWFAWLMRDFIGRPGALTAVLFLAFLPAILYYSRCFREDLHMMTFTLMPIVFFLRFWRTSDLWDGILCGIGMALMFCVKESSYLNSFIFYTFLIIAGTILLKAWKDMFFWIGTWLGGVTAAAFYVMLFKAKTVSEFNNFHLLIAIFAGASLGAGVYLLLNCIPLLRSPAPPSAAIATNDETAFPRWITLTLSFVTFWLVFIVFYTTCFQNPDGFLDGLYRKSLGYWLGQNAEQRLKGPFTYYIPIMIFHSLPLIILLFVCTAVSLLRRARTAIPFVALLAAFAVSVLLASSDDHRGVVNKHQFPGRELTSATFSERIGLPKVFEQADVRKPIRPASMPGKAPGAPWDSVDVATWLDKNCHFKYSQSIPVSIFIAILGWWMTLRYLFRRKPLPAFLWYWSMGEILGLSYAGEKVPWLVVHMLLPMILLAGYYLNKGVLCVQQFCDKRSPYLRAKSAYVSYGLFAGILLLVCAEMIPNAARIYDENEWGPWEMLVHVQTTPDLQAWMKVAHYLEKEMGEELRKDKVSPIWVQGDAVWPAWWYLRKMPEWDFWSTSLLRARLSGKFKKDAPLPWYFANPADFAISGKIFPPIIIADKNHKDAITKYLVPKGYVDVGDGWHWLPSIPDDLRDDANQYYELRTSWSWSTAEGGFGIWDCPWYQKVNYYTRREMSETTMGCVQFCVFARKDVLDKLIDRGILPLSVKTQSKFYNPNVYRNWTSFTKPDEITRVLGSSGGL